MTSAFGLPVIEAAKERYRYRSRTGECFYLVFAFLTGKVDFRTGQHIPDWPGQPRVHKVWSKL